MSSSSDEEMDIEPELVNEEANTIVEKFLPQNSKQKYLKAYEDFNKWRAENSENTYSESVFITYFHELSKKLQPSTLWSLYSMLKSTIYSKHGINFKHYNKLSSFLKRQSVGFKSKKSKVFSAQQVETFLNEAPDETYLATKVVLIFGISGACKSIDLAKLTVDNVEKHGQLLLIKLPNKKTKTDRTFVVQDEYSKLVQKYQALRPNDLPTDRFFLNYHRGKCLGQVIGKNKFASMPKQIARYLNLPNPELYTGRCFHRMSTKLLTNSGADNLTTLKAQKDWNSGDFEENYTVESVVIKSEFADEVTESIEIPPSTSKTFNIFHSSPQLSEDDPIPSEEKPTSSKQKHSHPQKSHLISSQNMVQTFNVPGKSVTLSFTNCSNCTINFH